jgi:hypothetical protein
MAHESDIAANAAFAFVADRGLPFLEKIRRLAYVKDASVVDIGLISALARFMGYDLSGLLDGGISRRYAIDEMESALRAHVMSVAEFNRSRNTTTAIEVVLGAFGLVGSLVSKYTRGADFYGKLYDESDVVGNDGLVPTLHFRVNAEISTAVPGSEVDYAEIREVIRRIKPVDTVFDGIYAHLTQIVQWRMDNVRFRNAARMSFSL